MGICENANEVFFGLAPWFLTLGSPSCLGRQRNCQPTPPLPGGTICMMYSLTAAV